MNSELRECLIGDLSDKLRAHKKLLESSQNSLEKYFVNCKIPGADKNLCNRRLNAELSYQMNAYREKLEVINDTMVEQSIDIYRKHLDVFIGSFSQVEH